MQIVCIATQMEAGGAQTAMMRLAEGLRARGHTVQTWFLYLKRPTFLGLPGVRVLLPQSPQGLGDYARVMRMLMSSLSQERPDAVITFTHYANVLGQAAARQAGVSWRVASQRSPAWTYPRIARVLDRILGTCGFYTSNVMVSGSTADSFANYPSAYRNRIRVVHNGIEFVPSAFTAEAARASFNLPKSVPLLVSVGRLSREKNQSLLLEALGDLPQVHLAVAGEGELGDTLASRAVALAVAGRVHFLGELPRGRVADLFTAADIFVMPSRYEGLSNALLEALASGIPVIASDIPSQAEVLRPPNRPAVGILLPSDDPHVWSRQIAQLLADHPTRMQLRQLSLERAMDFSPSRMIAGFEACLGPGPSEKPACLNFPTRNPKSWLEMLGVRVQPLTIADLHAIIAEATRCAARQIVANHNLHSVYLYHRDPEMRRFYASAHWVHIDGMPLVWLGCLLGQGLRREHRTTYVDWIGPLMNEAAENGWRVFYLGSRPGVAERGVDILRKRFSGLRIAARDGYFDATTGSTQNRSVLEQIASFKPQLLMVGMGMPRQEKWILSNMESLPSCVVLPCGAAIDYVAGEIATPPRWMGRLGVEWLYRLACEPRRLARRYLLEPLFLVRPLMADLRRRFLGIRKQSDPGIKS